MAPQRKRPSRAKHRSDAARARSAALVAAGLTKMDVYREARRRGSRLSPPSVYAVLDHRFDDELVMYVFCEATGLPRAQAFPADEPRPPRPARTAASEARP